MKFIRPLVCLAVLAAAACSTSRDETWIGKNVGVSVDSSRENPAPENR